MSNDSLKRVLAGIRGEARNMRKGNLKSRFEPKDDVTPENIHAAADGDPEEGSTEEENSESPEEAARENDLAIGVTNGLEPAEDETIRAIRKLLARV